MFRFFENRLDFYPAGEPALPPRRLVPFVWACTQGMRGLIALPDRAGSLARGV